MEEKKLDKDINVRSKLTDEEKSFEEFCKTYYNAEKGYSDWLANGGQGDENEENTLYQMRDIINLIQRQKAEIERLTKLLDDRCDRCIERERKDTAKDIYSKVVDLNIICGDDFRLFLYNFELWVKERYGVEVE